MLAAGVLAAGVLGVGLGVGLGAELDVGLESPLELDVDGVVEELAPRLSFL